VPLSQSLFDDLDPPQVWVSLSGLADDRHDYIMLTVRLKEGVKRSVSASLSIDRYAPTESIFLAVSKAIGALAVAQSPIDKELLRSQLQAAVSAWVDPF
jgi:hypothetical protein